MSSGKFVVRLDPHDHALLKEEALSKNVSLNQLCRQKLALKPSASFEEQAVSVIRTEFPESVGVLIYGSYARSQFGFGSDIDVMVLIEDQPSREFYVRWDRHVASRVDHRISPAFSRLDTNADPTGLWFELALDARVLWQKNLNVSRHLAELRHRIASGQYRRSFIHGQPYWQKVKVEK